MVTKKAAAGQAEQVPLVDYLRLGARPHLRAHECVGCGARYLDRGNACANGGKTEFRNARVRNSARVRAFTIVHRAAPGIPVPYVSTILTTYTIGTDDDGREAVAFGYQPV